LVRRNGRVRAAGKDQNGGGKNGQNGFHGTVQTGWRLVFTPPVFYQHFAAKPSEKFSRPPNRLGHASAHPGGWPTAAFTLTCLRQNVWLGGTAALEFP
jgi:hypothetical protein